MEHLIRRHVQPEPRVHEAAAILQVCPDAAMIDISDGLWNEASLLSDASRCAIFLPERSVPVSPALIRFAELTGWSALEKILFGGEDYELMFTSNTPVEKICDSLNQLGLAIPVTAIGDITTGSGVHLVDSTGAVVPLTDETFSHF